MTSPSLVDLNGGDLLNAALAYAERGWPVLPLQPRNKQPLGNLVPNGLKNATTDQTEILKWWISAPQANVALRTGIEFDVLDLDGEDGRNSFAEYVPDYQHNGPVGATGKGYHLLFLPTGARNAARKLPGIDFRGESGYIVAPPSIHPNGHRYEWMDGRPETLPEAPQWLLDLVIKPKAERSTPAIDPKSMANIVYVFMTLFGSIRALRQVGERFNTNCIFPDHEDSTPSFWLFPENNSFYCFGCEEWGDTLDIEKSWKLGLVAPSSWRSPVTSAPAGASP